MDMGRPKGEPKERRWIPVRLLAEVDALLARDVTTAPGPTAGPVAAVTLPTFQPGERTVTQRVAKESPFEARAHKRKQGPVLRTNEFGDPVYDD